MFLCSYQFWFLPLWNSLKAGQFRHVHLLTILQRRRVDPASQPKSITFGPLFPVVSKQTVLGIKSGKHPEKADPFGAPGVPKLLQIKKVGAHNRGRLVDQHKPGAAAVVTQIFWGRSSPRTNCCQVIMITWWMYIYINVAHTKKVQAMLEKKSATASARAMGRSDLGPGVILKYLEYVFVKRTLR